MEKEKVYAGTLSFVISFITSMMIGLIYPDYSLGFICFRVIISVITGSSIALLCYYYVLGGKNDR